MWLFPWESNKLEWKETENPVSWPHFEHIMDSTGRTISTSQCCCTTSSLPRIPEGGTGTTISQMQKMSRRGQGMEPQGEVTFLRVLPCRALYLPGGAVLVVQGVAEPDSAFPVRMLVLLGVVCFQNVALVFITTFLPPSLAP